MASGRKREARAEFEKVVRGGEAIDPQAVSRSLDVTVPTIRRWRRQIEDKLRFEDLTKDSPPFADMNDDELLAWRPDKTKPRDLQLVERLECAGHLVRRGLPLPTAIRLNRTAANAVFVMKTRAGHRLHRRAWAAYLSLPVVPAPTPEPEPEDEDDTPEASAVPHFAIERKPVATLGDVFEDVKGWKGAYG